MTDKEKMILWEALHECYSIASVAANSLNYHDKKVCHASYATLLERAAKQLAVAIDIVDNMKALEVES